MSALKSPPLIVKTTRKLLSTLTSELRPKFEADDVDIEDKRQWLTVARPILNHFRSVFGEELVAERPVYEDPKQISHKKWNVVFDGSCGFEIVSPVLRGKAGFETVVRALRSLRASGLLEKHKIKLSTKSGTHVHLGWRYNDPAKVREILFFMRRFEGAFHSLIASSRVFRSNGRPHPYCRSVRASFGKWRVNSIRTSSDVRRIFRNFERRYCALNLTNFDRPRSTLEIRSHHGTLNEGKICLWLALWMNVHNALARIKMNGLHDSEAGRNAHLPSLTADSDIVTVAQTHLDITVESNLAMLKRLHERRIEITGNQWWGNELGEQGIGEIHGAWKDRLPLSVLTSETPVLPEDIFIINELPKEMRLQTAKILIDSNRLQYADPSLLAERFNSGMLFVRLKAGAVIATAGVKGRSETVHRLSEDLRQAGFRSLGSEFRLLELKSAAQNSRVIERGWDFGELRGSQVPGIMGMADWLARKSIKEAVPVAFVTDEDSGGLENYQAAGWKMVGQITSPFTSNRLSVLLPL